jgi:DNA polymerase V
MEIYHEYVEDYPIRRIGINFGKLSSSGYKQINMFEDDKKQKNNHNLLKTMDMLKDKYGKNILLRASALTEDSTAIERHNQIGGHRK